MVEHRRRTALALVRPEQRPQRGTHQKHERHHRRDGVPGQAEHELAAHRAEPGGPPRLQRYAPEQLPRRERRQSRPNVVVGPDRDAAADDRHVGLFERGGDGRPGRLGVVANNRRVRDLAAGATRQRGDREGARIAHAAGSHRLARSEQLVSADEHRHPRSSCAAHLGVSE
jgi:hypothetical protein